MTMLTTETRPAPLPPRPSAPTSAPAAGRKPLPAGAVRWSKPYLDDKGVPHRADHEVPVDGDDKRTAHVRHTCRGKVEVTTRRQADVTVPGVRAKLTPGGTGQVEVTVQGTARSVEPCPHEAWLLPGEAAKFCPDHGCELTASGKEERKALLPWAAMWQALEPSARAAYLLGVDVAAGVAVDQANVPAWEVLAGTPAVAGAAWWGTRRWLTKRALKRDRIEEGQSDGRRIRTINRRARTAAYIGTAAGTWLTVAAATDPHTWPGRAVWASLPVVWAVTAVPWWRYLAAFRDRPEPEPAAETQATAANGPTADPAAQQDAADWEATVASADGLPHTYVDTGTWSADAGGRRMVIRARRGALTDERIQRAVPIVAAAFDVPISAIGWVAQYEGSPRSAQLLVQPNSPLNEPVTWNPIDVVPVDDARLHIGTRIDGTPLHTRLWTPEWGAPSRSLYGTKGSGKTEFLRLLLLGMLKARIDGPAGPRRLIAPFLHDPKLGKDFGAFRRQVCGFSASPETLHMIVDALIREMNRRYQMLADYVWRDDKGREQEGEQPFDPAIHGPVISLLVDEFHEPAKDTALMAKLDSTARKMRAAGIEVIIASHMTTLGDTGTQSFRDMVAEEIALFRTTSGLTGLATGGRNIGDPRLLPRVPGMNLYASGEEDTMQARMAYVPRGELYDLLYDDDNVSRIHPVEWPQETLDAFGPEFVAWMDACQSRPVGAPAPAVPKGLAPVAPSAEDLSAADALRRILFEATKPLPRKQIAEHPRWTFGVTSTLTKALRDGQDAAPPWLSKTAAGDYELTAAAREDMAARLAEVGQ